MPKTSTRHKAASTKTAAKTQKKPAKKSVKKSLKTPSKKLMLSKKVSSKKIIKSPAKKLAKKTVASKTVVAKTVTKKPAAKKLTVKETVLQKVAPKKSLAPQKASKKTVLQKVAPKKTISKNKGSSILKPLFKEKSNKISITKKAPSAVSRSNTENKNSTGKEFQATTSTAAAHKVAPDLKRPPLKNNKGKQKNMKQAVKEKTNETVRKVGTALLRADKVDRQEIKELDLSGIAETIPTEVIDPGFLTNDDVFDEADHAQWQQLREQASIHARAINLNKPEKHPDFDGEHCIDCDESIPPARLLLSKVRCVDCQNDLEQKNKILNNRTHTPGRSSDFDFD
mgnify:CR=1 FL=1